MARQQPQASLACVALITLAACGHRLSSLTQGDSLIADIAAGETRSFTIPLQSNEIAHLAIYQHEINVSVQAPGLDFDSGDWGTETVYLSGSANGPVTIQVTAPPRQTTRGKFQLQVLSIQPSTPGGDTALKAIQLEAAGHRALAQRTAAGNATANDALNQAAALWRQCGDPLREGHTIIAYGISLERLGRYSAADRNYLRAIELLRTAGDQPAFLMARKTWMNLGGHVGESRGTLAGISELLDGFRTLSDRRGIARMTSSLSPFYEHKRDYESVRSFKRQALALARDIGDRSMEADMLVTLAGIERQLKNVPESIRQTQAALQLARNSGDISNQIAISGALAVLYDETGNPAAAATIYRWLLAQHILRGDRSAWASATLLLAESERRLGHHVEARNLLLEIQNAHDSHFRSGPPVASYFSPPGHASLGVAASRLGPIPAYTRQAFWLLDSERTRFHTRNTADRLTALQQSLPEDTLLIEYVGEPFQSEVPIDYWLVSRQTIEVIQIIPTAAAAEAAHNLTANLRNAALPPQATAQSRALISKLLLAPLKDKIAGKKLVIVPDEHLSDLPFALLPDPAHTDGSLLGDHHEITYAPAGQAIAAAIARPRTTHPIELLLAADPVTNLRDTRLQSHSATPPQPSDWTDTARAAGVLVDGTQLPRLAYATEEARRLTQALPQTHILPLLGFDANRDRVLDLLPKARFVHFISHGLADLEKPRASGLALSFWNREGRTQDGFLRFDQISELNIDADLVTLAACETAVGRVLGSNGIPSLANAFLRAGARRVISSLWKVDDAATAELMVEFYKNLLSEKKPTPAQALWQAQKHVAAQPRWRNPYYWAGFTLSGDWRPL